MKEKKKNNKSGTPRQQGWSERAKKRQCENYEKLKRPII